jgi:hypothetical protein
MKPELDVICEVCSEKVAKINPFSLSLPLKGGMFQSPDPTHGLPPPFFGDNGVDFETMSCPHGRNHRPFSSENRILTTAGVLVIVEGTAGVYFLLEPYPGADRGVAKPPHEVSDEDAERIARRAIAEGKPVEAVMKEVEETGELELDEPAMKGRKDG